MSEPILLKPIGIVRSPYRHRRDAPDQGFQDSRLSRIEVAEEYAAGLEGIVEGDVLDVIYWMDRSHRENLWNERKKKGIFATRGPDRPNPLGICPVVVKRVEGNVLEVLYCDALDGSPLIDIRHSLTGEPKDLTCGSGGAEEDAPDSL